MRPHRRARQIPGVSSSSQPQPIGTSSAGCGRRRFAVVRHQQCCHERQSYGPLSTSWNCRRLRVTARGWRVARVEKRSAFSWYGQNFATPAGDYALRTMGGAGVLRGSTRPPGRAIAW